MADDRKANYYRSKILTPIGTAACQKLNLSLLDCIVTKGKGNCDAEFENFTECRNRVLQFEEAIPEYNDLFNCLSNRTGKSADECSAEAARYKDTLKASPKRWAHLNDYFLRDNEDLLKRHQAFRRDFLKFHNLPENAFESNKPFASYN